MPLSALKQLDRSPIEAGEYARRLTSILDALPVGVVLAEAPSGRILYGNGAIERMFLHPVLYSRDKDSYEEWVAFHADGARVKSNEYPLARVLAGEDRAELECRYRRGDGSLLWVKITGVPLRNAAGGLAGAVVSVTDIDALKAAQAQHFQMNRELHHRVNNALGMVLAITNLSARNVKDPDAFRETFAARVCLLSRTQLLLSKSSWEEVGLRDLLETAFDHDLRRIDISGGPALARSEVALAVALALHELKTNAQRYGALSVPGGSVSVRWEFAAPETLRLEWRERGGPAAVRPTCARLGLNFVERILPPQMGGTARVEFLPEGVHALLTIKAKLGRPTADAGPSGFAVAP